MERATRESLLKVLEDIKGAEIVVVGDLLLDRYIWGRVDRISPEAPVPVVEELRREDRLGGAGNVVRNLFKLGAKPIVCAVVGDDIEGRTVCELFEQSGADASGVIVDKERPTVLKTRVVAHTQQVVRIDRELRSVVRPEFQWKLTQSLRGALSRSKAVIVSDYGKGAISPALLESLGDMHRLGEVGFSTRPVFVDPHPKNYAHYRYMSIGKPNKKEAEAAAGREIHTIEDAFSVGEQLAAKWNAEVMVISLGEQGLVVVDSDTKSSLHLETTAQEVFDVSGAGDTVTAVFTSALAVGASISNAGVLANIAAGIVVSEVGTAAIDLDKLFREVQKWEG